MAVGVASNEENIPINWFMYHIVVRVHVSRCVVGACRRERDTVEFRDRAHERERWLQVILRMGVIEYDVLNVAKYVDAYCRVAQ